jgi:hypothetical protein
VSACRRIGVWPRDGAARVMVVGMRSRASGVARLKSIVSASGVSGFLPREAARRGVVGTRSRASGVGVRRREWLKLIAKRSLLISEHLPRCDTVRRTQALE